MVRVVIVRLAGVRQVVIEHSLQHTATVQSVALHVHLARSGEPEIGKRPALQHRVRVADVPDFHQGVFARFFFIGKLAPIAGLFQLHDFIPHRFHPEVAPAQLGQVIAVKAILDAVLHAVDRDLLRHRSGFRHGKRPRSDRNRKPRNDRSGVQDHIGGRSAHRALDHAGAGTVLRAKPASGAGVIGRRIIGDRVRGGQRPRVRIGGSAEGWVRKSKRAQKRAGGRIFHVRGRCPCADFDRGRRRPFRSAVSASSAAFAPAFDIRGLAAIDQPLQLVRVSVEVMALTAARVHGRPVCGSVSNISP
jgi:hypothetical protein